MPTPCLAIALLLQTFATAFTRPTFDHVLVLVYGTLLAPGRRTVTAALRAVGLGDEQRFTTYHRVLNRAAWSPVCPRLTVPLRRSFGHQLWFPFLEDPALAPVGP